MLNKTDYEEMYKTLEYGNALSRIKLRINELEFYIESAIVKSKFNIYCMKLENGYIKWFDSYDEKYNIICDTKIIKSFWNKLSKKEQKIFKKNISEENKKNSVYKIAMWNSSKKFIAHLKKLEKAGNKIERIN